MRSVSLILLCFIEFSTSQGPPPEEEECALNFDSPVYVCDDELSHLFVDTSDIEVHRHNETTSYMSGTLKVFKRIDSCTVIGLKVEKTTGSRTEVMVTHDICDLCGEMTADSNYHKYLKYFGFPATCPIEPGEYRIDNWVTDSEDLPVNSANKARYRATLDFSANPSCDCEEKIRLGCMVVEFLIEPV